MFVLWGLGACRSWTSLDVRPPAGPQANLQLRRLIVERQSPPDILLSGLVTPDDVTVLFEMYVVPPSPTPFPAPTPSHDS